MTRVNIREAKAHFSRYLKRVEAGHVITICRNTVPIAELRPVAAKPKLKRPIGLFKGQFTILPSFFDPLPDDELDLWYGKDGDPLG
jgi:prevent-host-death family protein